MADAIVGALFKNLNSLIQTEFGLVWGVQAEMKKLSTTLSTIGAVLEDAEIQQIKSKAVGDWLSKLKDAAYDADDILDEWSTNYEFLLHLRPAESDDHSSMQSCITNLLQVFCNYFLSCFNFKQVGFRYKIAKKMKEIKEIFDEIAKEKSDFHLIEGVVTHTTTSPTTQNRETSSVIKEPRIYGRDADKEFIVKQLLVNANNENDVSVLPILGIAGLGKTTLAQFVYNDERVVEHFDERIWVCVSDDFDVKRQSKAIIESVLGNRCDLDNLDSIQERLRGILTGKKFLLALDDVWNEKQDAWNALKYSLTSGAEGSSIIITTRLQTVASITGTIPAYQLELLSEDDCWSLFRYYAFGTGNEEKPILLNIGQEIVKKCGGVPLAAKALGSLLRFKSEEKQWELIRDSEIWDLEGGEENTILPALRLNYNNLSPAFRQCFGFCSLFPKDYDMKKEMLIHIWMANGAILSDGKTELEDIGEEIFNQLVWHSFFQDIKRDDFGNIVSFKVHDLLHDLACWVTRNECSTLEIHEQILYCNPKKVRHVSVIQSFWRTPSSSSDMNVLLPKFEPFLRSLLVLETHVFKQLDLNISNFLTTVSRLECLRMLHLRNLEFENLPTSLGKLKHLRYLNLESCNMSSFPECLCGLRNLQILNTSDNNISTVPTSIGKLENLRHLDLSFNQEITSLPESICCLRNLHTLKLKFCRDLERLPENIGNLSSSLRHLDIWSCFRLINMPMGIGQLTYLQTLNWFVADASSSSSNSGSCRSNGGGAGLRELGRLNHLRGKLAIFGLDKVSDPMDAKAADLKSKPKLTELGLAWWSGDEGGDRESSKEVLQGLDPPPGIQKLYIYAYPGSSFVGWMQMRNPLSSFPRLVEIELYALYNLEDWVLNWKENESLPALQSLSIKLCKQLETLPAELGNLRALRQLNVDSCEKLISLPKLTSLTVLNISNCKSLTSLPKLTSLTSLQIFTCHGFTSLPKLNGPLKSLKIGNCRGLTSLFQADPDPPNVVDANDLISLEKLEIRDCPQLELSATAFEHLIALQRLTISRLPQLTSFPEGIQNITTLKSLSITSCNNLRWPHWIHTLTSLQSLDLVDCHYLRELPESLQNIFERWALGFRRRQENKEE